VTEENIDDLEDLISSQTEVEWGAIKMFLQEMPTEELVNVMVELDLYVNKTLALEIVKRKDALFFLRKLIQDRYYWRNNESEDTWAHIHTIHLLALIRTGEAFGLFLDILRYRGEDLGDWLTENVPGLLAAFGEDIIESLIEFTEDETLESFVRGMAVTGLAVLARKYPAYEDHVKEHLIKLLKNTDDETFATIIIRPIAMFHDPSVLSEIRKAFDENKIEEFMMNKKDINKIINGEYDDEFERHTRDPLDQFSRKNIGHLHSIHYGEPEEYDLGLMKRIIEEPDIEEIEPAEKKVGRNAPCPCGSGKKYKKCCMGK
jgi:hypothetical protein